ncbi:MAG: FAD-binding oxidoreductase [Chloroflexi bacterium]|nr:FAD-binding oxidoreductase [Chloroflexota bacterium]
MPFPSLDRLSPLENFGHSMGSPAFVYRPTRAEQIAELFESASRCGYTIGLRGSGRSYSDAALNGGHIVLDIRRMNRVLEWNPDTGVIKVEPGVTIQQLWQYTLEDGWWPPVVPGTMFPTLAGCLAMNIHGKNNCVAGTIGEHVLGFTALLPNGDSITCTPQTTPDLFYGLISGAGLLGVFTSITLKLKRIYSGNLWVHAWASPNLRAMMSEMEPLKTETDYLVGWVDSTANGRALGRGQVHAADYLHEGDDSAPAQTLRVDYQTLPDTFFGLVPKSSLWQFMRPFMNNVGVPWVNIAKFLSSRFLSHHHHFLQSLVAFNFLLDYVPNWERSYGRGGLIQYQSFIPKETASDAFVEMIALTNRRGLPNYLSVLKRHRPDKFLLSHAVDGWSMAMDFRVTAGNRAKLQALCDELSEMVLQAGGRFYFAKDGTLRPEMAVLFLGVEALRRFRELKAQCDPQGLLQTELYRRLLCGPA